MDQLKRAFGTKWHYLWLTSAEVLAGAGLQRPGIITFMRNFLLHRHFLKVPSWPVSASHGCSKCGG